jgi:hypothetical protein
MHSVNNNIRQNLRSNLQPRRASVGKLEQSFLPKINDHERVRLDSIPFIEFHQKALGFADSLVRKSVSFNDTVQTGLQQLAGLLP